MTTQDTLASLGGKPVFGSDHAWPKWPVHDEREERAVLDVLRSGKWWFGERVAQFEKEFAAFQDAKYGISCTTGTAALEIVLQALGIGPGDEVLVPPYTFVATATAVMRLGATPIFVDVDDSWCMDPSRVEAAITPKTKALLPVHFGGRVCDLDQFRALAAKHGLPLIEDACHSWGSKWDGKGTGAIGKCGVFSFQHSKNITGGEGGIILTDNSGFGAMCRSIVNCGRVPGGVWYHHVNLGTNARLTEIQGAILSAQLTRLEEQTLRREKNATLLTAGLADLEGIQIQSGSPHITRRAYHLYCLRIDAARFGCSREKFIQAANAEGLPICAGYPIPLYEQPVIEQWYRQHGVQRPDCPVVDDFCKRSAMWFGQDVLLGTEEEMRGIIDIFKKIKAKAADLKD